ncbi:hypothetical protein EMCRGX_G021925 [Ephydatia muelleri]
MAGYPLIYELCCGIARQNLLPPLSTDHTFTSFVLPDHNTCNYHARLQETEAVLKFLALLAREDAPDQIQPLSQDSGVFCYDTYPRTHVSRMPDVRVDGDEVGDEREKVGLGALLECTDALPAKTWVGRVAMTHYLTESEGDTFSHAVNLALTTTAQVANVDPQSLLQSRDWSPVQSRQLLKDLQDALQNPLQHLDGKSSVSRSHAQGIRTLLHYCQCRLHELGDGKSDLYLEWASNRIVPIVKFLLRLVAAHPSQPEGLALIDALFTQAQRAQCTFLYPLLLGLLRQAMLPYLQYIHVRDHTFWTEGYRLVSENSCAPHFLAHLATPILTCGKGLNLLKLCNPSHPLCTRMFQPPPLCVPVTLEKMKSLGEQCEAYRMSVMQLCASIQEKQKAKPVLAIPASFSSHRKLALHGFRQLY